MMGKSLFGINILETDKCFHINLLLAEWNFDILLSKLRDITRVSSAVWKKFTALTDEKNL